MEGIDQLLKNADAEQMRYRTDGKHIHKLTTGLVLPAVPEKEKLPIFTHQLGHFKA